jgi:hypothetical protein
MCITDEWLNFFDELINCLFEFFFGWAKAREVAKCCFFCRLKPAVIKLLVYSYY